MIHSNRTWTTANDAKRRLRPAPRLLAIAASLLALILPPQAYAARSSVGEISRTASADRPVSLAQLEVRDYLASGRHCLSSVDGSNESAVGQIRARALHGDSFAHIESELSPPVGGRHAIITMYTLKDDHGSEAIHEARGWVDHATCQASLVSLG